MVSQALGQLQTYSLKSRYPMPEANVALVSSGGILAYQGIFGKENQSSIGASSVFDPKD
jgi:hypothetical protein